MRYSNIYVLLITLLQTGLSLSGLQVMNLFFISYKFYLFFFLIGFMKSLLLLGHDAHKTTNLYPEIIQYEVPAAFNRSPNTSLIRTGEGIVFIGKENGILTIDQDQVFHIQTEEPAYIGYTNDKKVVYLTSNDFGYIEYNPITGPLLKSQTKRVTAHYHEFYPYEIITANSNSFLSTSEGIFVLNDSIARLFFFNRLNCDIHSAGDQVFLEVDKQGLYQWKENEFNLIITPPELRYSRILSLVEWKDGVLICLENGETFLLHPDSGTLSDEGTGNIIPADYRLIQQLTGGYYLTDNQENELGILSLENEEIQPLASQGYLPSSKLRFVFNDRFGDVWVVYDFNIFKIEYPSGSYTLDLTHIIQGSILSTANMREKLYIGTVDGLHYIDIVDLISLKHRRISQNNNGYFHLLDSKEGLLIAAGKPGLFEVEGHSLRKISEGDFNFIRIIDQSSIICCSEEGLILYRKKTREWEKTILRTDIKQVISSAEAGSGIWLHTGKNRIMVFESDNENNVLHSVPLPEDSVRGLAGNNRELLVIGEKRIWRRTEGAGAFEKISSRYLKNQLGRSDLVVNNRNQLWSVSRDGAGGSTVWMLGNDLVNTPFFEITGERSFGQVVNIIGNQGYIWITGNKKIIRLDTSLNQTTPPDLLRIRSVRMVSETEGVSSVHLEPDQKLNFSRNKIIFNLADTRFLTDPQAYYRYKLTHYQEEWSDWTRSREIVFERLWERKYTFQAQSATTFSRLSTPVSFNFTIKPPIYRKWYAWLFYLFTVLSTAFLIYKWRLLSLKRVEFKMEEEIRERMQSVLVEKEKSDRLVADLFPKGTAEELISKGRAQSRKFEMATVLFSDIQGFTKIAEEMNPEILIDELDKFFFHFDSVVEKYNIEKIKTIGDAYMAAGGIPVKNSSNPVEVVLAGLEMQYYMKELKKKKADIWDLRIGIHTGPVITGVVGHKKLSYDIWGDTVNTASRMESSGEGGKVNISGTTYALVKDFFICEYRGKLPVKYKGNIDMYFVTGLRPELSVDLQGIPNRRFFTKLQMLKLEDLKERVSELIASNHLLNLHFHKKEFFKKVYDQTELLGRSENVSDEEMLLLLTAATLLFSGLSETYENFENRSADIARRILPEFGFDENQTERVFSLILATKDTYHPQNNLEAVLIDSRMEFIGRIDYLTQVKLLYLEEKNMVKDFSKEKFIKKQKALVKGFRFFTVAAQRLREISPVDQLKNLEMWK
jgi:adenylate cyclase